jgi:GMP synthase-like glutamine amidotransferase
MKIHYLQHVPFEGPGYIEAWASAAGHSLSRTPIYDGTPPPPPESYDWLIILGGPMSIHDEQEHPWLVSEKRYIRRVVESGKPVLGICLGAQHLAEALGARVYPNREREVGWFPVWTAAAGRGSRFFPLLSPELVTLHWHGETFDLPEGATQLARSEACENQAFAWGDRVLALQYHPEATAELVTSLSSHCPEDPTGHRWVQGGDEILAHPKRFEQNHVEMRRILDGFAEVGEGG